LASAQMFTKVFQTCRATCVSSKVRSNISFEADGFAAAQLQR
jgi:hypothetical protein